MAIINVDDAYILNETGAQVDKTTGIPFKNESLTEAEAAQARANIRAGGSNRNLLDNWYFVGGGSQLGDGVFPINQRGLTYYEHIGNYFDRWKSNSPLASPIKCTLQSEGVVLAGDVTPSYPTAYTQLSQVLASPPVGKTVTLSILTDSVTPDSEGDTPFLYTNDSVWTPITAGLTSVTFVWAPGVTQIGIILPNGATSAASLRMQAIKLEVGTVSTLANDAPPNYWEELERCLPYLWIWKLPAYNFSGVVLYAGDATNGTIVLTAPVSMREGQPTVAFTNTLYFGVGGTINSVLWAVIKNNRVTIACATSGGMTSGSLYPTNAGANDVTITIANEL